MKLSSDISAVVTGGASGLGAATARRLAKHGVKVALFDLNAEAGEALAKEIGGVFCKVDVTSEEQVDAAFAKARAAHRPGAHPGQLRRHRQRHQDRQPRQEDRRDQVTSRSTNFDRIIQINLVGTFRCIAKSAAGMLTLTRWRRRARRHRQHRLGRGRGRPDRPGRLFGVEGRHRRHDPADRPRPDGRRHPRQHHPAGHLRTPRCWPALPRQREGRRWPRRCPSPSASGNPTNTPRWR